MEYCLTWQFWVSLVAQSIKNLHALAGDLGLIVSWEAPLEGDIAIHFSVHREAWKATVRGVARVEYD